MQIHFNLIFRKIEKFDELTSTNLVNLIILRETINRSPALFVFHETVERFCKMGFISVYHELYPYKRVTADFYRTEPVRSRGTFFPIFSEEEITIAELEVRSFIREGGFFVLLNKGKSPCK